MTEALSHMTKLLTLIGLTILVFGYSYSPLLLHIYGGQLLSTGIGNLDFSHMTDLLVYSIYLSSFCH